MERVIVDGSWDRVDPPFSSLPPMVAFNGSCTTNEHK
ncbi:hypothetical protein OIU79_028782 [Salix purpurea]|uniref:Uncharacterized protein n=1 Tax=Salix purpurea TaxID=77065 RepID=A0A9Q0VZC1_SALPP|nr:hypothetical protein OIU79_028782 [Salix purpurea]